MENKKWSREESEQNKDKLLQEIQEEPFNTSGENLDWVIKELDQLIDEEEVRQNKQDIPKNLINFIDKLVGGEKNDKYHISPLVIDPITNNFQHSIIETNNGIKTIKYKLKIESLSN
jgi:hypothetical protein